jgi:hypothetical protein
MRMTVQVNHPLDLYRIEKERLQVTLTLLGGTQVRGYVFVSPRPQGHAAYAEPAALLNEREDFFPVELETGEVLLVSKQRVLEVSGVALAEEDEVIRTSTPMALLEITLAGGITHYGSMLLEVRGGRRRLLDLLNSSTQRFLVLYTDNGIRLVNRALIESVRPLD